MGDPRLAQAAALLAQVLTQVVPFPCTLEQIETQTHALAQALARQAAEQYAGTVVDLAEATRPQCACGAQMAPEQRRARALLLLMGLVQVVLRRYRCPRCGTWRCPGAEVLQLRPRQRMTRTVQEILCHYGLAWSYAAAATLLTRVLPGLGVSAKTIERATKRCAAVVQEREDQEAAVLLEAAPAPAPPGPAFAQPRRIYLGLDGVLVRGRQAKQWLEVQVGSFWSAWRELPNRKHFRRQIIDATVVARAMGWEKLGEQVWRMFVHRGGLAQPQAPEVVVLGDGARGIRSLWELHFPDCLALLDPWHLWEKVKLRSREVFGYRRAAKEATRAVYRELRRGAVEAAQALVEAWPAREERAQRAQQRLLGYLERNRDTIRNYPVLRQQGYMVSAGRTEKVHDLVVVPRMKNGKMHWSPEGANAVALLRASVLNDPQGHFLPT